MSTRIWTVISLVESTGQVLADWVVAEDEWDAFTRVCQERATKGEDLSDIELVAAIIGKHSVGTPSDTGSAAWAIDYPH